MKFTNQAYLLLVAAIISPTALAQPVDNIERNVGDSSSNDPDTAPHTESAAAVVNPGFTVTDEEKADAVHNKKMVTFTSDNPNWGFTMNAP